MDGSLRNIGADDSFWEVGRQPASGLETRLQGWLDRLNGRRISILRRFHGAFTASTALYPKLASRIAQAARPAVKALSEVVAAGQAALPAAVPQSVRRALALMGRTEMSDTSQEPDPIQILLSEFNALDPDQKDKVARNLTLLWDNFQDAFDGLSGFLAAPTTEQDAFMEKLEAAAERMRPARGTEAGFHYVTVELTRQYIAFLRVGKADRSAVALATCVVSLIDRGRQLRRQAA